VPFLNNLYGQQDANGVIVVPPSADLVARGPVFDAIAYLPSSLVQALSSSGGVLPSPANGHALIDTGASCTCIDNVAAKAMGLQPISIAQMTSASHSAVVAPIYAISLELPAAPGFKLDFIQVMGAELSAQGLLLLIGRDILQGCQLVYNGALGLVTISY
jgi:predicted aspartyl protease